MPEAAGSPKEQDVACAKERQKSDKTGAVAHLLRTTARSLLDAMVVELRSLKKRFRHARRTKWWLNRPGAQAAAAIKHELQRQRRPLMPCRLTFAC